MTLSDWIQEHLFQTYVTWHMKSPLYNSKGFHIDGINNSLKAMEDGIITYTELYPPYAVQGCTSMKARVGKSSAMMDLYLELEGKCYVIENMTYVEGIRIMRDFVKKRILPERSRYVETVEFDKQALEKSFAELAQLLIGDSERVKQFMSRVRVDSMELIDDSWYDLYEVLLACNVAADLSLKIDKESLVDVVEKLAEPKGLNVNEAALDEDGFSTQWIEVINSSWQGYSLIDMDIGTDYYVLLVLSDEEFKRAEALSRMLFHRMVLAEKA